MGNSSEHSNSSMRVHEMEEATSKKRKKYPRSHFQRLSTDAKIRRFLKSSSLNLKSLKNSEHQCQETSLASQIDAGEPAYCVLEEYFDRCIDIQPDDPIKQNDSREGEDEEERKLKLNLEFGIFTDNFMEQEYESTAPEKSMPNSYWFLKLLASKTSLEPLCKHPYITAFLDLHYSTVKNARKQMVDSIPHLALMLVLGQLASTMPGHLHDNYENLLILALLPFGSVILMDVVSLLGEKTELINQCLKNSLCSSKKQITSCRERLIEIYSTALYLIGYFISISSLVGGCYFHFHEKTKDSYKLQECYRDKKLFDWTRQSWREILEYTLIAYPTSPSLCFGNHPNEVG